MRCFVYEANKAGLLIFRKCQAQVSVDALARVGRVYGSTRPIQGDWHVHFCGRDHAARGSVPDDGELWF